MYKYHKKLSRRVSLRLLSYLFIDLKAHRTRVLEVAVEFKRYIKTAVIAAHTIIIKRTCVERSISVPTDCGYAESDI